MHRHHLLIASLALAGLIALPGCANKSLKEGRDLIAEGKTDEGILKLREGVAEAPRDAELKAYYHTQRERQTAALIRQAELEIDASRFEEAQATLARVLALHPENPRARSLSAGLADTEKQNKLIEDAHKANAEGKTRVAERLVRQVLAQSPENPAGLTMQRELLSQRVADEVRIPALADRFEKPVTMEFRGAPIRSVFDMISRQAGINFVFDKDVRLDTRATLFARNTPVSEAIDLLLSTGQLAKKVINDNTLLIYPNQPQKQKDYQALAVKSFYLGNADPRSTLNMLRTLIKTRDAYIDEKLNLLIIRDTPEAIAVAERLIAAQDLPEPEVMLEVEILEVQRNRLLDLGAQFPNQFGLLNLLTQQSTVPTNGGAVTTTTTSLSPLPLTLDKLRDIDSSQITINDPVINLRREIGDVNLLANPRIRVKNREKAKIHIGDKVPIITSNATSNGVVSESVSYLDVGLKLDVEPKVMQHNDVEIKINLEVSNIVREIRSNSGTLTYQIGTRNAGTVLRLRDGETQVLAGLISESDRKAASRIPGLGDLPLIGRLFGSQRDETSKNEIVLLITPRVLRNTTDSQPASSYFPVGTESAIGIGLNLRKSGGISGIPQGAPAAPTQEYPPTVSGFSESSPGAANGAGNSSGAGYPIPYEALRALTQGNAAPPEPEPAPVDPNYPGVGPSDEAIESPPPDDAPPVFDPSQNTAPPPDTSNPVPELPEGVKLPPGASISPNTDLPVPTDFERGKVAPPEAPSRVGGFQDGASPTEDDASTQ